MTATAQADEHLRRGLAARVHCTNCGDDYPTRETTRRSGRPYCGDCAARWDQAADRHTTRHLAYTC
ncbi:hypothetical protein ACIQGZ_17085 [Streptomyces sp. NPDC092296]|uniref:hypothetical protein n=1 Tax=Streptomyces sp. NPDC092296 TaxID=3366012 RepID=UPI00380745F8